MNKHERRSQRTEFRSSGRGLCGYSAKFNTLSDDLGGFVETIAPGAFDLEGSPCVILNYEHDDREILDRTDGGTLVLKQDDVGLWFECPEVPNTTRGNDCLELVSRNLIHGCSFAFQLADDPDAEEWGTTDDGKRLRTLKKLVLFDCCICVHPAYSDTEVAVRNLAKLAKPEPKLNRYRMALMKLARRHLHR